MTEAIQGADPRADESQVRTFLIADVRGYTAYTLEHGDEAGARLAESFAALAQEGVAAHGGQVIELRGDEALAVFSSARQALRAAVDLQARFAGQSGPGPSAALKVGIGLDAGEAVPVEGGYRGASLNLAARLCSRAGPGEVLASDTVVNLARKIEGVEYAERGMESFKGFSEPVRVMQVRRAGSYRPSGPGTDPAAADLSVVVDAVPGAGRSTGSPGPAGAESRADTRFDQHLPVGGYLGSLPASPLIAREREIELMLAAVETVAGGTGRLVTLAGEPGAGKTRLAQEVTLHVHGRGFTVVAGRCYEPQQAVPFYPFLEALTTAYAGAPAPIRSELLRRWPGVAQLLPSLGLPVEDYAAPQNQQRLLWAVTGFFQALAEENPLAILLDDLHWADAASLDLLQHLARHMAKHPILVLGTYRDVDVARNHPLEAALRDLKREGILEQLPVRRLAQDGTAALIAATMGEAEAAPGLVQLVYQRTEGNPFFVQQVMRMLVERGDIKEGRWIRKAGDEIEVPDTVRSVIGQRLSNLSETTQEILHEASALGQTFGFEDLQEMAGRAERELEEALEEAQTVGLIREAGRDEYGFDHALTQQALYSQLASRRKRRLHLAAGEAIERSGEASRGRRERRAAELAWHFLEADDPPRALRYSMLAGDQAEEVFAHEDAAMHYHTALDLARQLGDAEREAAVRERLGGLLTAVIRYDEALPMLEQAAKMYRATGNREAEARVVAQIGRVHVAGGSVEQGVALLQETLASLGDGGTPSALAALSSSLGRLLFVGARYGEALRAAERAAQLARDAGVGGVMAEAEVTRGAAITMLGRWSEGLQTLEAAVASAEEVGDVFSACRGLQHVSGVYLARGEMDAGRGAMARALALAERMSNRRQIATTLFGLSLGAFLTGDLERAHHDAERARRYMGELGGYWLRVLHSAALSLALSLAEWSIAPEALKACVVASENFGELFTLREERMLAEQDLLAGNAEGALVRLRALMDNPALQREQAVGIIPLLASAYLAARDPQRAQAELEQGLRHVKDHGLRLLQPELMRVRGATLAQGGDWAGAARAFREGLAAAERIPYPFAEARLRETWGQVLAGKDDAEQAREELGRALALYRRLGADAEADRIVRALAGRA